MSSFSEQIINIIEKSITLVSSEDWDDTCEEIISNLLLFDFKNSIDNYQPCIYISKQELSLLVKKSLFKLSTFFTKVSDEMYIPKENISEEEIERLLETAVKILMKKQEGAFINISFSTCPNPETELREKDIQKVERLIQKEKFNYLIKKSLLARSITSLQAKRGLDVYREMLMLKVHLVIYLFILLVLMFCIKLCIIYINLLMEKFTYYIHYVGLLLIIN